MPLPVRLLQVSTLLRTNLITRALAAVFDTSQSTTDRIIHHLIPVLADAPRPTPHDTAHSWIIDGTLIPGARPVDHRDPARTTAAASTLRSSSALIGDVRSSPASPG